MACLLHKVIDCVIANIRKRYIDTRTQTNLSKLNANCKKDIEIVTTHISEIDRRRARNSEILESTTAMNAPVSPIWGSPHMEEIAMKWTPIALIVSVAAVLLWARVNLTESFDA
ncbi:hypothetical protein BT93_K2279 [Corymbia citriodora subsp. variegata]|nr:hypothetical protein BT93_K2279 [Corymbia citriodora subsp. variegata]